VPVFQATELTRICEQVCAQLVSPGIALTGRCRRDMNPNRLAGCKIVLEQTQARFIVDEPVRWKRGIDTSSRPEQLMPGKRWPVNGGITQVHKRVPVAQSDPETQVVNISHPLAAGVRQRHNVDFKITAVQLFRGIARLQINRRDPLQNVQAGASLLKLVEYLLRTEDAHLRLRA
jgi:hypothetical protein